MRKLAQLMFMALAMCFVACGEFGGHTDNGNGNGDGNGNGGSNDTPLTFNIEVSSITSSTAKVTIIPSNENTYYFDIIDKETIDTYYEGNFENWAKDKVDYILNDLGETFANYVSSGKDVCLFEDLDPSTDYFAYAFGVLNDGTITTSVAYKSFKTLEGSGSGNGGSTGGGNEGGTYEDMVLTGLNYADYENYGDYYGTNACNWLIYMDDYPGNNVLIVEVQTPLSATDFVGSYQISDNFASGTAVCGFIDDEDYLCGSYWSCYDSEGNMADYLLLVSGSVKITKSGTTYTVEVDAMSDMNTSIKATYTGAIEEYVETAQVSPTSTLRKFSSVGHKKAQKAVKRMPVSRFKIKNAK